MTGALDGRYVSVKVQRVPDPGRTRCSIDPVDAIMVVEGGPDTLRHASRGTSKLSSESVGGSYRRFDVTSPRQRSLSGVIGKPLGIASKVAPAAVTVLRYTIMRAIEGSSASMCHDER